MAISRRTDYALRLVAALAQSDGAPMSVRAAAEAQQVPYAFARSIQHDLVLAGIVTSRRGAHGGTVLAKPADELTVLDVIDAVQGGITLSVCVHDKTWCPRSQNCAFHYLWVGADKLLYDYLEKTSIAKRLSDFEEHGADARLLQLEEEFNAAGRHPAPCPDDC